MKLVNWLKALAAFVLLQALQSMGFLYACKSASNQDYGVDSATPGAELMWCAAQR